MTPDFLKNLPIPARMLLRPMLMISLVLHGVVLMLPISSDLRVEQPKTSKQYKQVKLAQLPTTRPSPISSPQSSAKPNPQPSQSTPAKLPTRPQSSWELNPQPSAQRSQSTPLDSPTRPKPITIRRQSAESPVSIRKSSSRSEQQPKNEEEQQPSPQQPTPSPSPQQPTPSPSPQQPTPSPSPQQPSPSPSPQQPTPSPSTDNANPSNEEGSYSALLNQNQNQLFFKAAIEQVKYKFSEEKLKQFQAELDINKLSKADKFKDATGKPDARFDFRQKAISPLSTQDIVSALEEQLKTQNFSFDKIGTYGDGPIYEVKKGGFKRYLILAPGKDETGDITAIIVSQDYPG